MSPNRTQLLAGLTLLALLPVGLYVAEKSAATVTLSAVSVVLVAASLYLMLGPSGADSTGETT